MQRQADLYSKEWLVQCSQKQQQNPTAPKNDGWKKSALHGPEMYKWSIHGAETSSSPRGERPAPELNLWKDWKVELVKNEAEKTPTHQGSKLKKEKEKEKEKDKSKDKDK